MAYYLLDTGLLIRHLRGQRKIVQLMRHLGRSNHLAISTVTRLELYAGMHPSEELPTRKLLSRFASCDLDDTISARAGRLIYSLRQQNQLIGVPDAIIAATALSNNMVLVTLNVSDFELVPSLRLYPLDDEY